MMAVTRPRWRATTSSTPSPMGVEHARASWRWWSLSRPARSAATRGPWPGRHETHPGAPGSLACPIRRRGGACSCARDGASGALGSWPICSKADRCEPRTPLAARPGSGRASRPPARGRPGGRQARCHPGNHPRPPAPGRHPVPGSFATTGKQRAAQVEARSRLVGGRAFQHRLHDAGTQVLGRCSRHGDLPSTESAGAEVGIDTDGRRCQPASSGVVGGSNGGRAGRPEASRPDQGEEEGSGDEAGLDTGPAGDLMSGTGAPIPTPVDNRGANDATAPAAPASPPRPWRARGRGEDGGSRASSRRRGVRAWSGAGAPFSTDPPPRAAAGAPCRASWWLPGAGRDGRVPTARGRKPERRSW